MFRLLRSCIVFAVVSMDALAQPGPDSLWSAYVSYADWDYFVNVSTTPDHGYLLAGTGEPGNPQAFVGIVTKLSADGQMEWSNWYDYYGTSAMWDVLCLDSSRYLVAGAVWTITPGPGDYLLMQLNADGDTVWTHLYGTEEWSEETPSLCRVNDGGIVLAGAQYRPHQVAVPFVVKTDSAGNEEWTWNPDTAGYRPLFGCAATLDGGFVAVGEAACGDPDDGDFRILKFDSAGDLEWDRCQGVLSMYDEAWDVCPTPDGGYLVAGYSYTFPRLYDFYVMKLDSAGDQIWAHSYGMDDYPSAQIWEEAYAIDPLPDGTYVVSGYADPMWGGYYALVVRIDSLGNILWRDIYGPNLESLGGTTDGSDYIIAGWADSPTNPPDRDAIAMKLHFPGMEQSSQPPTVPLRFSFSAFPNPFNPSTNISFSLPAAGYVKLAVYDITGREIKILADQPYPAGEYHRTFDGADLPSGIFFAQLTAGSRHLTRKLLHVK